MTPLWFIVCVVTSVSALAAAARIELSERGAAKSANSGARDQIGDVLQSGGIRAYRELDSIGRRMQAFAATAPNISRYAKLAFERSAHDLEQAHAQLNETLADPRANSCQMQHALAIFSRHYSEFALQLGDIARLSGHAIAVDDAYRNWLAGDWAYSDALWALAVRPDFLPLANAVRAFFDRNGFAASRSLRELVSPGEKTARRNRGGTPSPGISPQMADRWKLSSGAV
jgi:hypothetical protein